MAYPVSGYFSHQRMLRGILRRPGWVFLLVAGITLFFVWKLPGLSFRTSVYDLVIEDLPETARYEAFKKQFGSDEIIRVVVRAESVFDPETFAEVARLAGETAKIPGIRRVISLPGVKKEVDLSGRWSLQEFSAKLAPVSLFYRNLLSADHRTTALTLILTDQADRDSVISGVERLIAQGPKDLRIYQIGMPLVSRALAQFTEKDLFRLLPLIFVLIAATLYFLFRSLTCVILPVSGAALAVLWTFGMMAVTQTPLSMMTVVVPVFLIAVGTAYCLHICSEYLHCSRGAASSREAVLATFSAVSVPTLLAVSTTVIGLGALLLNRIEAIREFAVFSCFGLLCLLLIVFFLFPALLCRLPLPSGGAGGKPAGVSTVSALLDRVIHIDLHRQRTALCLLAAVGMFFAAGIFGIRVETNPLEYFRKGTPVARNFDDIYRDLSGSFPVHVVMDSQVKDNFEDPEHLRQILRLQEFLEGLSGVDKAVSFADYLKLVNYATNRYDPAYYSLPQEGFEIRMLINNFKSLLGDDLLAGFMSPDFSSANILLFTHLSGSRDFLRTRDAILAHVRENFPRGILWDVTGFGMVMAASSHLLIEGQVKSLSLTMALIFGVMLLLFLSGKVGLIAIVPNAFPIVVGFGFMGWFGIHLSMVTAMIASIAIGLAVDDTIHYLVRYNREFKKDLDKDRSFRDALRGVGAPIIFTTLTVCIGFAVLVFSSFKPTAFFGLLMVVTMISALVADLILLPSLMLHVELVTAWDLLRLMPAAGGLSGSLAHELNEPLNVIKTGSEFLKIMLEKGQKIEDAHLGQVVTEISNQVDRASEVVRRLGELGRKAGFSRERLDVNRSIRDSLALVGHHLRLENIAVELDLVEDLPPVRGHRDRMEQVVVHLLTNAAEAIDERGEAPGERRIRIRSFPYGHRVALEVSDTGTGVPEGIRDRIFEPFFTTKETGKGKGLGLAVVHEVVKDYGGGIEVRNRQGSGACFTLFFPACEDGLV
jgi:hypothetical protein